MPEATLAASAAAQPMWLDAEVTSLGGLVLFQPQMIICHLIIVNSFRAFSPST
jgi:hypothetical protein